MEEEKDFEIEMKKKKKGGRGDREVKITYWSCRKSKI